MFLCCLKRKLRIVFYPRLILFPIILYFYFDGWQQLKHWAYKVSYDKTKNLSLTNVLLKRRNLSLVNLICRLQWYLARVCYYNAQSEICRSILFKKKRTATVKNCFIQNHVIALLRPARQKFHLTHRWSLVWTRPGLLNAVNALSKNLCIVWTVKSQRPNLFLYRLCLPLPVQLSRFLEKSGLISLQSFGTLRVYILAPSPSSKRWKGQIFKAFISFALM